MGEEREKKTRKMKNRRSTGPGDDSFILPSVARFHFPSLQAPRAFFSPLPISKYVRKKKMKEASAEKSVLADSQLELGQQCRVTREWQKISLFIDSNSSDSRGSFLHAFCQ